MPSKPFARIAITLPQEDLAAADRIASEQDRSRSWVIAEAVRQYARAGLGPSRHRQLAADLRLTPEQRVRAAEDTEGVATLRLGKAQSRRQRVLAFERYDDFLDWKRSLAAGG